MNLVDTGSGAELDMETMRENLLEQGLVEDDITQTTITQRVKGEAEDTSGSARTEIGSDAQAPLTDLGEAYRQKRQEAEERAGRMPKTSNKEGYAYRTSLDDRPSKPHNKEGDPLASVPGSEQAPIFEYEDSPQSNVPAKTKPSL